MHVVAALSLPAIAVAADALVRRWRVIAPVAVALLLVGIPGNVEALADQQFAPHVIPGWVRVRWTIAQSDSRAHRDGCEAITSSVSRHLDQGQSLVILGGRVRVFDRERGGRYFDYQVYDPQDGETLTARAGPITLTLARDDPKTPVKMCAVTSRA
jgi:hypothetical protein